VNLCSRSLSIKKRKLRKPLLNGVKLSQVVDLKILEKEGNAVTSPLLEGSRQPLSENCGVYSSSS